jgi:hypothetical protein
MESFTPTRVFIFCELCPKAAVFLPLLNANRVPSVNFQRDRTRSAKPREQLIQIVKEPVPRRSRDQWG